VEFSDTCSHQHPAVLHAQHLTSAIHHLQVLAPCPRAGDVHGCYDELMALLDKLKYDQGSDNLVLVGDLVNKVE
jgi:hypothetical protein